MRKGRRGTETRRNVCRYVSNRIASNRIASNRMERQSVNTRSSLSHRLPSGDEENCPVVATEFKLFRSSRPVGRGLELTQYRLRLASKELYLVAYEERGYCADELQQTAHLHATRYAAATSNICRVCLRHLFYDDTNSNRYYYIYWQFLK